MKLYHGGHNLESDYLGFPAHRKGSWEHGPGLYLINNETVARKYAKGGKSLYEVTVDVKPQGEISNVMISEEDMEDFVTRFVKGKSRPEFRQLLRRNMDRRQSDMVAASVLVNLSLNLDAVQHSKTGEMREWLSRHGVTHTEVSNYGGWGDNGYVIVVVNPKMIKKIKKL